MEILLALAAYNEEPALPQLLEKFRQQAASLGCAAKVVVVDDGSTDGTWRVMEEWSRVLPIETVRHMRNLGLGESVRDALRLAAGLSRPEDVVITMDADNTHPPELIPTMIERLKEGRDLVIASRYRPGSKVVGLSLFRHVLSYGARILLQVCFPIPGVRDYTCAFRAYRAEVLQQALARYGDRLITEQNFACAAEILIGLRKMGVKMCEVPFVLRYDLKVGRSKMNTPATILQMFRLVARNLFL